MRTVAIRRQRKVGVMLPRPGRDTRSLQVIKDVGEGAPFQSF